MTENHAEAGNDPDRREFEADGVAWIAEVTGRGAAGGPGAAGTIESVYFRGKDVTDPALRLAYLPARRFRDLMDDELRDLLRTAPPLASRPSIGSDDQERAANRNDDAIEEYTGGGDG